METFKLRLAFWLAFTFLANTTLGYGPNRLSHRNSLLPMQTNSTRQRKQFVQNIGRFTLDLHASPNSLLPMQTNRTRQREQFVQNLARFTLELHALMKQARPDSNIIYSPISIQACLALLRTGAEGETARELDLGLRLLSSHVPTIAESFHDVLSNLTKSEYLKISNRVYVMRGNHLRKDFLQIATRKFFAGAEEIDFGSDWAVTRINNWVAAQTDNLIQNAVKNDVVNKNTRTLLLNAIYFKGQWEQGFDKSLTRNKKFYLNEQDSVEVPMMSVNDLFPFAYLPELDATAVQMPYKNTDISMLVILPNSRTGLRQLENKLRNTSLSDVIAKMHHRYDTIIEFPKFKVKFSMELTDLMMKLGMKRLFTHGAQFGRMLEGGEGLGVSHVIHDAFIEVDEEGTKAGALIQIAMLLDSGRSKRDPKYFTADRPFFYALTTGPGLVLFAGSVVGFNTQ